MKIYIVIFSLIWATWAHSQTAEVNTKPTTNVIYEKKTKLDFEDRDVDGEFMTPDGQAISADKNLHFESMLDPKDNFKKELKRSMGAVR
jgi:hypothetical protein